MGPDGADNAISDDVSYSVYLAHKEGVVHWQDEERGREEQQDLVYVVEQSFCHGDDA
jgi:hypothetical protein